MLRGRAKVFVGRSADANREEREAIARQLKEEGYALTPPPEGAIPRGLDRDGFTPIDLRVLPPVVRLRHTHRSAQETLRALQLTHVLSHRRGRHRRVRALATEPIVDAARRVALLARRRPVGFQNPIDEILHPVQRRLGPRLGDALAGGTASAKACRTTRRWTPSFRDTPLMVPTPN